MRGAKRDVEEQLEAARGTVGGTAEGERFKGEGGTEDNPDTLPSLTLGSPALPLI